MRSKYTKRFFTTLILTLVLFFTIKAAISATPEHFNDNLFFIENKGQIDDESVLFYTSNNGLDLFITSSGISYVQRLYDDSVRYEHRVDARFVNGNNIRAIGSNPLNSFYQFYFGEGETKAKHFSEIILEDVYPGVDVKYYFTSKGLKYDIIVDETADYERVKIEFEGLTKGPVLNESGDLILETSLGNIQEGAPKSFINNAEVESRYKLENGILQFDVSSKKSGKLIIDPTIKWSTFHGGAANDRINAIDYDSLKNLYVTGTTSSANYPATTGAHQTTIGGSEDIFISKFDSSGALKWATFFGGLSSDEGNDIAVTKSGNAYVVANTTSNLLNVTLGALQVSLSGGTDAFVIKLNNNGVVQWSSYFGGTGNESANAVALDNNENIYITGSSNSTNLRVSTGAFQTSLQGAQDGFITKLSKSGNLIWSTFIGGSKPDEINDIYVGDSANVYLAGQSNSNNFPITLNGLQTTLSAKYDAVIAKFDSSGARKWATYYGGNENDFAQSIVSSKTGLFVTGFTQSRSLQMIGNSNQDTFSGGLNDGFLLALSERGGANWSSYLGGSSRDEPYSIDIEGNHLMITGFTQSANFPVTNNAYQKKKMIDEDAFVSYFDTTGNIQFSSFFGGTKSDFFNSAIFYFGASAIGGYTQSTDYYTTTGVAQSSHAGNTDGLLTIFCPNLNSELSYPTHQICFVSTADTIFGYKHSAEYKVSYQWQQKTTGTWGNISGATDYYYYPASINTLTEFRRITSNGLCFDTSQIATVRKAPVPNADFSISGNKCVNDSLSFSNTSTLSTGNYHSKWTFENGDTSLRDDAVYTYNNAGSKTISLTITTDSGCFDVFDTTIVVNPNVNAAFVVTNNCTRDSIAFTNNSQSADSFSTEWFFGDGSITSVKNPKHYYNQVGLYKTRLIVETINGCTDSTVEWLFVDSALTANFSTSNVCSGDSLAFINSSTYTQSRVQTKWLFGDGDSSSQVQPKHYYKSAGKYNVILILSNDSGCVDSIERQIEVYKRPQADFENLGHCQTDSIQFIERTNYSGLYTVEWNFGDGNTSTMGNPYHKYANGGIYLVSLRTVSSNGCADSTSKTIFVDSLIDARFQANSICFGDSVRFVNSSTYTSNTTVKWFFGNGDSSSNRNPNYQYSQNGQFLVQLVLKTDSGCTDTFKKVLNVHAVPIANLKIKNNCDRDSIIFKNTSTHNMGYTATWVLGNGDTVMADSFKYLYKNTGIYNVSLTIENDSSCIDTNSVRLRVDSAATAQFTLRNTCVDSTLDLLNNATPKNNISTYQWSFGDGAVSNARRPLHTYNSSGQFLVKLVIKTDVGCEDSIVKPVKVTVPPRISASYLTSCESELVRFEGIIKNRKPIYSIAWNMGDGVTIKDTTDFYYDFITYGTQNVIFRVSIDSGTCAVQERLNPFVDSLLSADFESYKLCNEDSTEFVSTSELSSGNITYVWDLGDGTSSNMRNPKNRYNLGNYTVKLIVSSDNGCVDSVSKTITIEKSPLADFNHQMACFGDPVKFNDESTGKGDVLVSWEWWFGGGNTSNVQNPNYIFRNGGVKPVKLVITTDKNCTDTFVKKIRQSDSLFADIIALENVKCFGDSSGEIEVELVGGYGSKEITWTHNNSNSVKLTGLQVGTYNATVIDSFGCESNFEITLTQPDSMSISNIADQQICEDDSTNIRVNVIGGTPSYTYNWSCNRSDCLFDTSTGSNIIVFPDQKTTYSVFITDSNGCKSRDVDVIVTLKPKPNVSAIGPVFALESESFKLDASADTTGSFKWFPDNVLDDSEIQNPTATITEPTRFVVRFKAENGCLDSDTFSVGIFKGLGIPTAFTPNNDGVNDGWYLENIDLFPNCEVVIYTRQGKQLFYSKGYNEPWTGLYNDKELPGGSYYYVIKLRDDIDDITGSVTILK